MDEGRILHYVIELLQLCISSCQCMLPEDENAYLDEGQNARGVGKYGKQSCVETRP